MAVAMADEKMQASSHRTPAAGKAPTGTTPSKPRSSQGSPATGKKRKIKTEVMSPTQASSKSKSARSYARETQTKPQKKQKAGRGTKTEIANWAFHTGSSPTPGDTFSDFSPLTPLKSPSQSQATKPTFLNPQHLQMPPTQHANVTPNNGANPNNGVKPNNGVNPNNGANLNDDANLNNGANSNASGQPSFLDMMNRLFNYAVKVTPTLLPPNRSDIITSIHLDNIAYKMYQLACAQNNGKGSLFTVASQYSSLFSELKLRALARLNYLPCWWLFRERALVRLTEAGMLVDDTPTETLWMGTLRNCFKTMEMVARQQEKSRGSNGA